MTKENLIQTLNKHFKNIDSRQVGYFFLLLESLVGEA